jgi:predicted dehydrogenase
MWCTLYDIQTAGEEPQVSDRVRTAVVGLGWWGDGLARALAASERTELTACFARTKASREDFAQRHGCRAADSFEALVGASDVDAVMLATPHSTHPDLIETAAEHGKHVFVEKPLALTVIGGRRAFAATERNGVVLQVGHNRRYQTANRRIKAMIDAGDLGMVHLIQGHIMVPKDQVPRKGWRSDPDESPVGGMTALGIHMVDTFRYFAGPIERVHVMSKQLWAAGRTDDISVITMEFARGPLGYLATSIVLPKSTTTTVMGTSGIAWNEDDGQHLYVQSLDELTRTEVSIEPNDTILDEIDAFARAVSDGERPETGGPEGLEAVAVLDAIVASAASGQPMDVRDFR